MDIQSVLMMAYSNQRSNFTGKNLFGVRKIIYFATFNCMIIVFLTLFHRSILRDNWRVCANKRKQEKCLEHASMKKNLSIIMGTSLGHFNNGSLISKKKETYTAKHALYLFLKIKFLN